MPHTDNGRSTITKYWTAIADSSPTCSISLQPESFLPQSRHRQRNHQKGSDAIGLNRFWNEGLFFSNKNANFFIVCRTRCTEYLLRWYFVTMPFSDPTFPVVNPNPTVDDCVKSMRWRDYFLMGGSFAGTWAYGYAFGRLRQVFGSRRDIFHTNIHRVPFIATI